MGRIPGDVVERVREAASIDLVVQDYVSLKRSGKHLKGLCPFHAEKTPSFTVSVENGLFYCYGCHKGGNVFQFLMEVEHIAFPEAVRRLAQRFGVPLREQGADATEVLGWAATVYQRFLREEPEGQPARTYLRQRSIPARVVEEFGLGACPPSWQFLVSKAQREGIPLEVLEKTGLVVRKKDGTGYLDRFRDRLIFPLHGTSGDVLGFAGRVLPGNRDEAKYINSSESSTYHKSRYIYGMYQARKAMAERGRALVVEGYLDAIRCHERGFEETVAVSGTALTPDQVHLLRRRVEEVVVAFDGDRPGRAAARRAVATLLQGSLPCRVAALPEGEDPDSFLCTQGADAFRRLVDTASPAMEFLVASSQRTRTRDVVAEVTGVVAKIPDPLLREEMARELARVSGFSVSAIMSVVEGAAVRPASPPPRAVGRPPAWEEQVCRHLLLRPAERVYILDEILPEDFTDPTLARICEWISRHGLDLEAGKIVDALEDQALRQECTKLVMSEAPLGPVDKDVIRFKIEKLVRHMRDLRKRVEEAEGAGAKREVEGLLAQVGEIASEVERLRRMLNAPAHGTE